MTSRTGPATCQPMVRREVRRTEAEPVLDRIGVCLTELERRALPKSVREARLFRMRRTSGGRYVATPKTDGCRLTTTSVNGRCVIRRSGEKTGCSSAASKPGPAAVLFTILAGAKRHRIEPWTYLRELLLRLHDDDPRLDEMLPDRWAANHPESILNVSPR